MTYVDPFTLPNLQIVLHQIEVYDVTNAEDFVRDFYVSLGYSVRRASHLLKKEAGLPDWHMSKNEEKFFVEVKTNGDGLRFEQLQWIKAHPDLKVVAFYLRQQTMMKEVRRMRQERDKRELERENLKKLAQEAITVL